MKTLFIVLAILFTSCVEPDSESTTTQPLGGFVDCTTTAIPDDGLDDRQAIQDALTYKGCAILGPGVYNVVTPFPRVYGGNLDRYDMLKLTGNRLLKGAGPATTLLFEGDAGAGAVQGIGMTGSSNFVSNLRLQSNWTNTSEQTHQIQLTGPAPLQNVSGVWFKHPSPSGGDCIKVVGYSPAKLVSFTASNNIFEVCDRSGIAIHSGLTDATVTNNLFLNTGDQDIDLEGAGGPIENLTIVGNVFRRLPTASVKIAVALGADDTRRATFTGNVMDGGRLFTYNIDDLVISGNNFSVGQQAIEMVKSSKSVSITGNTFTAYDTETSAGAMISCSHHNSGTPGSISISGNIFRTSTLNGRIASLISASDVVVSNNTFVWTPLTPPIPQASLIIYGITKPTESILVVNNVFRGPWTRALQVTNTYEVSNGGGIRAITFSGNQMKGVTYGVFCSSGAGPGPYVVYGNSGSLHSCATTFSVGN